LEKIGLLKQLPHLACVLLSGRADFEKKHECALKEVAAKQAMLEEVEKNAVRAAMIEERSHFCRLIDCLKPVMVRNELL